MDVLFTNIILCGLGCRDTLRLEAGLSLYGNELNEDLTPVEANLSWAISKSRFINGGFNGFQTILSQCKNRTFQKTPKESTGAVSDQLRQAAKRWNKKY